jgi:hypothetical protein
MFLYINNSSDTPRAATFVSNLVLVGSLYNVSASLFDWICCFLTTVVAARSIQHEL